MIQVLIAVNCPPNGQLKIILKIDQIRLPDIYLEYNISKYIKKVYHHQ
tara:strand:- start:1849 stop:1992 length:144 start_codon:yes stop_codon:yes gene_type:complete